MVMLAVGIVPVRPVSATISEAANGSVYVLIGSDTLVRFKVYVFDVVLVLHCAHVVLECFCCAHKVNAEFLHFASCIVPSRLDPVFATIFETASDSVYVLVEAILSSFSRYMFFMFFFCFIAFHGVQLCFALHTVNKYFILAFGVVS